MATEQDKINAAKQALIYFHTASSEFSNYPFINNAQGLLDQINYLSPTWMKNFGNAILSTKLNETAWYSSDPKVKGIMEDLADELKGNVPAKTTGLDIFFEALSDTQTSLKAIAGQIGQGFLDAPIDMAKTAKTVVTVGAAAVGAYAAYKVAALAITGLGVLLAIYNVLHKGKSKKVQNPRRNKSRRK